MQRDAGRVPGFDPAAAQAIKAAAAQASKSKAARKNDKRKQKKHEINATASSDVGESEVSPEAALQRLNLGNNTADGADGAAQLAGESDDRAALEKQVRALRKRVRGCLTSCICTRGN